MYSGKTVVVLLSCMLAGCAAMTPIPPSYRAEIPCTPDAATEIVTRASTFLQGLFGPVDSMTPEIVRYPDATALRQALGFSASDRTSGFYDRAADRIHVACSGEPGLTAILMHESTHRYLNQRFAFAAPAGDRFTAGKPLPAVPPWLQEGLASWMEAAQTNQSGLEMRVNAQRLAEFRQLMRRGWLPPLERVLAKGFDEPFRSADYAAAWALVWYLMQDSAARERLAGYLEAAKRGLFDDPDREYPALVAHCADFSEFSRAWDKHVSDASVVLFRRLMMRGQAEDEWQRAWRKTLWLTTP